MSNKKGYKRLQFDFANESIERIDKLVIKIEASSRVEVIRRSLRIFEYLVDNLSDGYEIELKKDKETKTIPLLL